MRDVLIQKELPEFTGLRAKLGQGSMPIAPNDSRVIFRVPDIAMAMLPLTLPPGPILYGHTILILASYDVPDKANFTKRYVGEVILVRSEQPLTPILKADKTYQGYVKLAGIVPPAKFWISDITEVPAIPPEDEVLPPEVLISSEWWRKNWPWVALGGLVLAVPLILGIRRKRK